MTLASINLAGPHFTGEWPAGLWIAVGAITLVTLAIALVLNKR